MAVSTSHNEEHELARTGSRFIYIFIESEPDLAFGFSMESEICLRGSRAFRVRGRKLPLRRSIVCQASAVDRGIHSPLGGQGLNLGLGDAMNLGWKLAATIRGEASNDLLDSYSSERHPIGASVLDWSRAQVALMRPSRSSRALGGILRDIIDTRDGATYFAEHVWGVSQRYDLGGNHPLVGCSVPDFERVDGSKLGVLLRDGRGMLLNFEGHRVLRSIGQSVGLAIPYAEHAVKNRMGLCAVLVRPDGIVAWACDGELDVRELIQALSRWLPYEAIDTLRHLIGNDPAGHRTIRSDAACEGIDES